MPLLPVLHHGPLFLHVLDDRGDAEVHLSRIRLFRVPGFSGSTTGGTGSGSGSSSRQEHVMHAMTAINKYPNVFIFFNFMFFILSPLSRRIPV